MFFLFQLFSVKKLHGSFTFPVPIFNILQNTESLHYLEPSESERQRKEQHPPGLKKLFKGFLSYYKSLWEVPHGLNVFTKYHFFKKTLTYQFKIHSTSLVINMASFRDIALFEVFSLKDISILFNFL